MSRPCAGPLRCHLPGSLLRPFGVLDEDRGRRGLGVQRTNNTADCGSRNSSECPGPWPGPEPQSLLHASPRAPREPPQSLAQVPSSLKRTSPPRSLPSGLGWGQNKGQSQAGLGAGCIPNPHPARTTARHHSSTLARTQGSWPRLQAALQGGRPAPGRQRPTGPVLLSKNSASSQWPCTESVPSKPLQGQEESCSKDGLSGSLVSVAHRTLGQKSQQPEVSGTGPLWPPGPPSPRPSKPQHELHLPAATLPADRDLPPPAQWLSWLQVLPTSGAYCSLPCPTKATTLLLSPEPRPSATLGRDRLEPTYLGRP